ncbi:MAG: PIG-L family deacetylase [Lachnospiraceae bacterium]|nr:PIG-L family deacetylase [Lachnospiraceae bacterium]MBD5505417.1 PIG-L family deacetylase [Lachnospiraceae bacterium]
MRILVVSPHPDDETLGAGGTLLKCKRDGHSVYWLNVTNMKLEYGYSSERINERIAEIEAVKKSYCVDGYIDLGLEPAGLNKYETGHLISLFKESLEKIKPEILFIPYKYDVHSDHRIVCDVIYSCTKSFRAPYINAVLAMEILSETDQAPRENAFAPNIYVDISEHMERKIEIAHKYKSEIKETPFPRNEDAIRGLASYRGAASLYKYSEAFYLVKSRVD